MFESRLICGDIVFIDKKTIGLMISPTHYTTISWHGVIIRRIGKFEKAFRPCCIINTLALHKEVFRKINDPVDYPNKVICKILDYIFPYLSYKICSNWRNIEFISNVLSNSGLKLDVKKEMCFKDISFNFKEIVCNKQHRSVTTEFLPS